MRLLVLRVFFKEREREKSTRGVFFLKKKKKRVLLPIYSPNSSRELIAT